MAIALLTIAIVLLTGAAAPELIRVRDFSWYERWVRWLDARLSPNGFWHGGWGIAMILLVPVLLLAALAVLLNQYVYGIFGFALGLLVLHYCLGPRDLGEDLTELAHAHTRAARDAAAQAFGVPPEANLTTAELIEPVFAAALKRLYAPVFWFVAFGAAGVLLYRLTQLLADARELREALPAPLIAAAQHFESALAWMPAQLMSMALALASDFDAVARAWRDHHDVHGRGLLDLNLGFLTTTAKACMDLDDVDETDDPATPPDNAPLLHAQQLIGRITVAWLAALALIVLAAFLA